MPPNRENQSNYLQVLSFLIRIFIYMDDDRNLIVCRCVQLEKQTNVVVVIDRWQALMRHHLELDTPMHMIGKEGNFMYT